ncbi:unnamed protein product [Bursaphelenchus xylophilus]|uniref:(pine wood nematode) hypothetical protein n=1 Tax=Bursaphelenchus xylophilus TaxID=6326 RepID=A0A7I8XFU9_BURXY|nr:unnamed protein product [Bursaphelenchus xylophilus]CAG9080130.1 unnamed protein product [Bursaphelenchus xylophilus]
MQRPAKPSPIGYSSVFYYAQFVFINSVIWLAVSVMELAQPLPYDLSELMNSTLFNRQEDQEICRRFQTGGMERLSEFASPFFPSKYPPNTECIRTIHAPPGYDIVFRFSDVFQIEASYEDSLNHPNAIAQHCPNDFLEIRDGRYSFSPLVGRFCGMRPPPEIRAQSGYAWLNFHSDGLIEERGFSAEYEFVRKWNQTNAVQTNDCHQSHVMHLDGYVNVSAVQLSYLNSHPPDQPLECVYKIRVPNTLHVAIFIEQFELAAPNQCEQNYVEIYSGQAARKPLKRFCGIIATHTYTGQSVVFLRIFVASKAHADNSKLKVFFSAYSAYKNCSEHSLFSCGDDVCIPHALVCNNRANCLYRNDETSCNRGPNPILDIFSNTYSPLMFTPILIAAVVTILGLWYKPCRQLPLTTEDDLQLVCSEPRHENFNMVTFADLGSVRRTGTPSRMTSLVEASTQTPRVQKHTTFAENGHVQRERAVNTSSPTEIWHTEESYSTRTPSVQMESLSIDTSLMTVNV